MFHTWIRRQFVSALALVVLVGCGPSTEPAKKPAAENADPHAGHDHSSLGPHQGHLIGLGDEQYHAEWRFDTNSGKISIYLLDAAARKDVVTTADKLTITIKRGETTTDYELPAINQDEAEPPTTSRFETVDTNLLEFLRAVGHGIDATLTVAIGDKEYSGPFEHLPH